MTKQEFLQQLKNHFIDHDWCDYDERRIMHLIEKFRESVEPFVIIKKVPATGPIMTIDTFATDMDELAVDICKKHNITIEELKADSPAKYYKLGGRRKGEYLVARRDFVRNMLAMQPHTTKIAFRDWFGYKCHSSIIHLLKY